jgi:beta-galactosidase
MNKTCTYSIAIVVFVFLSFNAFSQSSTRKSFNGDWQFHLGDVNDSKAQDENYNWRKLNLPHDWSIELPFDSTSPTGNGGGALRGGIGWYKKTFSLPESINGKKVFIDFDGVYMNSAVYINNKLLGIRPNGYISFRYDVTPYLKFGNVKNILLVKVNNDKQPNSRWYSGSGIYRNVWVTVCDPVHIAQWGTYVTTQEVTKEKATVKLQTSVANESNVSKNFTLINSVYNAGGKIVKETKSLKTIAANSVLNIDEQFQMIHPQLWSVENPYLYKIVSKIIFNGKLSDEYTTPLGLRSFHFDAQNGFSLNGKSMKIRGVCEHHDLGCLGTALNITALRRQLRMLKEMGVNAIRTSHNPPAPEFLELSDKMGFIIMDETFDMWKKEKNPYDYHLYWDEWHKKDLEDQILRDRNHPSVFIWSVGNEIPQQRGSNSDTSGKAILRELYSIVKKLDNRPVVTANDFVDSKNQLLQTDAYDIIGYNYHHRNWDSAQLMWGNKPFIATESTSALQTRGSYDMLSDSIRRWPYSWENAFKEGNADLTCSAYDNCSAPWGSTHEESLKIMEKRPHVSGMFIWTGFDYIGEPTPYPWPARSSYFGIIDLAGFPKDAFYLYQSIWTNKPVLHLFPHWNWQLGQTIDMWAYYNNADEVELFINGKSQGIKKKTGDDLHVMWRVLYEPGTVKVVSRKKGKIVLTKEIKTAGDPYKIILSIDTNELVANSDGLAFVIAKIVDKDGNFVPYANNSISFSVDGGASFVATDNGHQTDLSSFQSTQKKAWNGLCLAVIKAGNKKGNGIIKATSEGLQSSTVVVTVK